MNREKIRPMTAAVASLPDTYHRRAFTFSLTPFDDSGEIDETALRAHLGRLREAGVGVYMGSPGSGEGNALSRDELRRIYEIGVDECKGHVPIYAAGFEPRTASEFLHVAREAVDAGLEAIQLYAVANGHGMVPTPQELEAYFREMLDAIELPVIISSHHKIGYATTVEMLVRLCDDYPNIFAINAVQNEVTYLVDLHHALGDRVEIYSGGTKFAITNLALGGIGFNSAETNVMPRTAMTVVEAFHAGDVARAVAAHTIMLQLSTLFAPLLRASPRPMKTLMNILGLPGGHLRPPYLDVDAHEVAKMTKALERLDILGIEERGVSPT